MHKKNYLAETQTTLAEIQTTLAKIQTSSEEYKVFFKGDKQ